MIYSISTKDCKISEKNLILLERHLYKLSDLISKFSSDLPLLYLVIRWHSKKDYYDGALFLDIPKKRLYAVFEGKSIEEAVQLGFERIEREIDTYKGLHFTSDSEYYDRSTLEEALSKILSKRSRIV